MKIAPARTRATRWGALTARQRSCADSMSLNAMASPAAREPGPLVTLLRCLTVAKVDSIVIWSPRSGVWHVEHGGLRARDLPGGRGYLPLSITRIFRRNHACSAGAVARLVA